MKEVFKNSCTLLIWIAVIFLGFIVYRSKAIGYGENTYKTFLAFKKILFQDGLFWILNLLILIQGILLNFRLKHIRIIYLVIGILTTICSVIFCTTMFREIRITQISYNELEMDWSILPYKIPCLVMAIIAIGLTGYNTYRAFIKKDV